MHKWLLIQKMLNTFYRGIFILYQQMDQKKEEDMSKLIGNEQIINDMEHKHLQKIGSSVRFLRRPDWKVYILATELRKDMEL